MRRIGQFIDSVKDAKGTKDAPTRSCKDLALAHPEFKSGST